MMQKKRRKNSPILPMYIWAPNTMDWDGSEIDRTKIRFNIFATLVFLL